MNSQLDWQNMRGVAAFISLSLLILIGNSCWSVIRSFVIGREHQQLRAGSSVG